MIVIHDTRETLTPAELRVLSLLAKGYTRAEVARVTERSIETVKTHIRIAREKLRARNTTHACVMAALDGII